MALEFPVAGLGSRFVALLLDHVFQGAAIFVLILLVVIVAAMTGSRHWMSTSSKWFFAILIALFFLLFWGYYTLFEAFWHGQTPGKRIMHLRVIKDSGRQITLFEAMARNLLRFVDYMPSAYLAGVITMLCNKRNKRLGDLAAGTLVIHERVDVQPLLWTGSGAPANVPYAPPQPWQTELPASAEPLFPADAVARLSGADLTVVEAFFARALDLPLETRASMAQRIAGEMTVKMGVGLPAGSPERTLEALAVQMRAQGRRR